MTRKTSADRRPVAAAKTHICFDCRNDGHMLCIEPACRCWCQDERNERLADPEVREKEPA